MEIPGRASMRDMPQRETDPCGPMPNPVSDRQAYVEWQMCKQQAAKKEDVDVLRK